ncbi:hypothetical protein D046_8530, partial [Vibrio parahaemolyticus V-223/04]
MILFTDLGLIYP